MASKNRIGGLIQFKVDGEIYNAKGNFSYMVNKTKKEMIVGADGVHGYSEKFQVPYIEGALTDTSDLNLTALQNSSDVTATLELYNGKMIVIEQGVYASDGVVSTEEGEIEMRFEGMDGREVS